MRAKEIELRRPDRRFLQRMVVEHGFSPKRCRDSVFVRKRGIKVRKRITIFFDSAGQAIQATEAIYLLRVSQTRRFQRPAKDSKRFIVRLEALETGDHPASMREGESRRV